MNKEERPRRKTTLEGQQRAGSYIWLAITVVLLAIMFYLYFRLQGNTGPVQPISFSHRVHAGTKEINCRFCHQNVERSQHAGLPAMEKCLFCHTYIIPNHPEIQKEDEYYRSKKPVSWRQVFYVPDFVFFNHVPHLKWGGLDCIDCHGDVKTLDRIKETTFQMGFCVDCHRKKKAQTDCWLACHR